jgi:hypothetical protein
MYVRCIHAGNFKEVVNYRENGKSILKTRKMAVIIYISN